MEPGKFQGTFLLSDIGPGDLRKISAPRAG